MPILNESKDHAKLLEQLLSKAEQGNGLLPEEAGYLLMHNQDKEWKFICDLASRLTQKHFSNRIHLFAPLYFSNYCANECTYCGFRHTNQDLARKFLTQEEFVKEAAYLWQKGHRTLLLVSGEHRTFSGARSLLEYLVALSEKNLHFKISLEVGPLELSELKMLRQAGVKRFVLYQETYDRNLYDQVHAGGRKRNYDWRYAAPERALMAGFESVGLGVLLGIHNNVAVDLMGLYRHGAELKQKYGRGPSTLSFPRIQSASGMKEEMVHSGAMDDLLFERILALTRVTFPSTGIVLTTRESETLKHRLLKSGIAITHMSAGVSTSPGGYTLSKEQEEGQFSIADHRSLKDVAQEIKDLGYEPVYDWDGV